MDRRAFLEWTTLAAALGVPLLGCNSLSDKGDRSESILIVGAGVAGLGAAWALQQHGYTAVTLLEARGRVGGRVWTSEQWPGHPVDLGASWIHGTRRNPITRLAKDAAVPLRTTDYENVEMYGTEGQPFSDEAWRQLEALTVDLYVALGRHAAASDRTLQSVVEDVAAGRPPAERLLLDYLVNTYIEQDFAADAHELSPLAVDYGKEFGGDDVLFPEGYFGVFAPRLAELDIRTNQRVEAITYDDAGVQVRTHQGTWAADRAIITLPIGVLQRGAVVFSPPLPEAKRAAIAARGSGVLNKAYLRFPRAFWPEERETLGYVAAEKGRWATWLNLHAYTEAPVLLGFNAGTFGRTLEAWSDEAIVASAMDVLRTIYGASIPEPEAYQLTRWASDPFAYGAYSFMGPGVTRATVEALAEPVAERLFFAGEATSVSYPSTVHGAYLSGQREARRIARL